MLEDEPVTPLSRGKTSIDPKKIKTLNKLLAAGFDQEKAIVSMSIDQILKLPGVKLDDVRYINELQKSIRENRRCLRECFTITLRIPWLTAAAQSRRRRSGRPRYT